MIWATVSSWSCFCWLYRASPSLVAKNISNLISASTIWWCPCVESSLVLLKEDVCYDHCVFLAKLYYLCPDSFRIPRPNLPVTLGVSWLPTFAFQSPIMKRTSFLGVSSIRSCTSSQNHSTSACLSRCRKVFDKICGATQDGRVMVERSDRMWSIGEGNGKPLQCSCLENPMNSMKRQNDRILKEELPRWVSVQHATGDQWRNTPERMKGWSQTKNNIQLRIWLVIEARSNAVKSNIA